MAMTTTPAAPPPGPDEEHRDPDDAGTAHGGPVDRVGQLRGAGVQVDGRRVAQVAIGIVLATLAVLAIVFTVAAVHTNQQDDRLHDDGVPVTFTVTGCLGLLGGSGSNAAGYSCHGTYTLDGHRYAEPLPGNDFHRPGSTVPAVAVPVTLPSSPGGHGRHRAFVGERLRASGDPGGSTGAARRAAAGAAPPASAHRVCGDRSLPLRAVAQEGGV